MAKFIRPLAGKPPISAGGSFQDHVNRRPTSVNPGCDYAVGLGTPILAPANGVIKVADTGLSGAGGRTINMYYDVGGSGDFLHLSRLAVSDEQRVTQGQIIGYTGGSANGSETGVGKHLHYTHRTNQVQSYSNSGNVDPETVFGGPIGPMQRQVGPIESLRRVTPDRTQPDIDPDLQPGEIGNFTGWIRGEEVAGNSVWFRGTSGNWFWSGGFTDKDTHDLEDLNPKPPTVLNKRTCLTTSPANTRSAAHRTAAVVGSVPAGAEAEFAFWVKGEMVNGIDMWYVTADQKQFSWAGGYTTQSTAGLVELPPAPVPPQLWPTEKYSFTPANIPGLRVVPADWSNFENKWSVPDKSDGTNERKGFPALPTSIVDHQWGDPNAYSLNSVLNTFQGRHDLPGDRVASHFVVGINAQGVVEKIQMVGEHDRAYHAGSGGNDFFGIEIDPRISDPGTPKELRDALIAAVREIHIWAGKRNGNVALINRQHRNLVGASTSCGTWIEPVLPLLDVQGELTPPPDPDPEPTPGDDGLKTFIDANIKFLQDYRAGME